MTVDDPETVAKLTAAFHAYEAAMVADDMPVMGALFHDAPSTVRDGAEIRASRKGRGGSPQRWLGRVAIHAYGRDLTISDASARESLERTHR